MGLIEPRAPLDARPLMTMPAAHARRAGSRACQPRSMASIARPLTPGPPPQGPGRAAVGAADRCAAARGGLGRRRARARGGAAGGPGRAPAARAARPAARRAAIHRRAGRPLPGPAAVPPCPTCRVAMAGNSGRHGRRTLFIAHVWLPPLRARLGRATQPADGPAAAPPDAAAVVPAAYTVRRLTERLQSARTSWGCQTPRHALRPARLCLLARLWSATMRTIMLAPGQVHTYIHMKDCFTR